jgi:ubiquitin-protein ligase E3 C
MFLNLGSASGGWTQPDRFARMAHRSTGRARAVVRRGQVAQDGFDRLFDADLKAPVEITFVDQFGNEEYVMSYYLELYCLLKPNFRAGIDGGGVFKEFFTSLCKEVFDTDRGLWLANKQNELYPNPHSYATEGNYPLFLTHLVYVLIFFVAHSLNWYRFIGRILGKALYEGILVDVAFAGFFLAKVSILALYFYEVLTSHIFQWLGKQSFLDDLASLDPDLYQGLIFLKNYAGNPEDLSLNFTIAVEGMGLF